MKKLLSLALIISMQTVTSVTTLMNKQDFVSRLYATGAVQFGEFIYTSGMKAPNYIDLRRIISFPDLLQATTDLFWQNLQNCSFDLIAGVPYGALGIATAVGVTHHIPLLMPRTAVKTHGTKQRIEGVFTPGQRCLVIEDLLTTGKSCLDTIKTLEHEGLIVTDVAIILDREQGGKHNVEKRGYRVHVLFTLSELVDMLCDLNLIDVQCAAETKCYSQHNQCTL